MKIMNLEEVIVQDESESLERKVSISDASGIGHTACAFANQPQGGFLVIGVDKSGEIIGIQKSRLDEYTQKLANIIQNCRPTPKIEFHLIVKEGKNVLIVQVQPLSDEYACFFSGKVYVRTGNTTRALNETELIEFLRVRQILSFEETSSSGNIEDLDFGKIRDYLKLRDEKIQLDEKTALQNLGLLKGPNKSTPTNLAMLFFSKNIESFIPQTEIRLTRFKGIEPIYIANSQRLNATIIDAIEKTIGFIELNTVKEIQIEAVRRTEKPEYPQQVIREAVINAVGHRDYFNKNAIQVNIFDDRIEITNPGPLPKDLLFSELGKISIHRNPHLYQLLSHAKYGEGLGTGIPRMIEAMRTNTLPDPFFEEISNFFRVTLYNKKSAQKIRQLNLTPTQEKVLKIVLESKSAKASIIAEKIGYSLPPILSNLKELEKRGLIKKIGKTRGAYYIPKETK